MDIMNLESRQRNQTGNFLDDTFPYMDRADEAVARSLREPPRYGGVANTEYGEDVGKLCRDNLARLFHIREPGRMTGGHRPARMAMLAGEEAILDKVRWLLEGGRDSTV